MPNPLKLAMIGAGSPFALNVIETMEHTVFGGCRFALMDSNETNLNRAQSAVKCVAAGKGLDIDFQATTSLEEALEGVNYVIVACERDRNANWLKDIEIPERHGVFQITGENGGPGGQIHGMRNIGMFMPIVQAMEAICPDAWMLNFTNPMSILCTWLDRHTAIKYAGFCHQVHGSFGVIAEQLGLAPGELEVTSAGINHLNWLFDLRRKGRRGSWLPEFLKEIQTSKWWSGSHPHVPRQDFSLEIYRKFGMYPIGYDDHICEYLSCFPERQEWDRHGLASLAESKLKRVNEQNRPGAERQLQAQHLLGGDEAGCYPFPADPRHPHYRETACDVIAALETNTPLYLDAMVGRNEGAVSNLPPDAIVDRPVVVVGGMIRSVHVGELPPGPAEICRRQIALHEMIVRATVEGDRRLAVQALCLDPYVRSMTQAEAIWADFFEEYRDSLPTFR